MKTVSYLHALFSFHFTDQFVSLSVFADAVGPLDWSQQRFDHVIRLRQQALDDARRSLVDFLLVGLLSRFAVVMLLSFFVGGIGRFVCT